MAARDAGREIRQPRRPRRPCRSRGHGADAGAGATDYIAVVLLIATIAAVIAGSGIGGSVVGRIDAALCRVSPADCEDNGQPGGGTANGVQNGRPVSTQNSDPVSREEWGDRTTDPNEQPPDPTEEEREAGEEAADKIRDYLDHDCDWYQVFGCDGPTHPTDVLRDMSPAEIAALFDDLSDDEIRRLMQIDGVADILKLRADPSLLRRIEQIAPGSIEPVFNDVMGDDGKKPSDPATGYGHVPGGQVFGGSGGPQLTDIDQGSLGNCWWMASLGALATTEEGRRLIQNMITQNPNGTYTVTFPDGTKVNVTPFFPVKENGSLAYAQPRGTPPVLWPLILEKALAQKEGSYGALVGGRTSEGMSILTGQDSETQDTGDISLGQLRDWLDDDRAVTVDTLQDDDADGKDAYVGDNARLVTGHSYVLRGVTNDGKVMLYNPWGNKHVVVSIEEFNTLFSRVDINPVG